jgi:hypothetical protein
LLTIFVISTTQSANALSNAPANVSFSAPVTPAPTPSAPAIPRAATPAPAATPSPAPAPRPTTTTAPATSNACHGTTPDPNAGGWIDIPINTTLTDTWFSEPQPGHGSGVFGASGSLTSHRFASDMDPNHTPCLAVT